MKRFIMMTIAGLMLATGGFAQRQTGKLSVHLNKYFFNPGDTLKMDAAYAEKGVSKYPPATLQIIIENNLGNRTRLRWPLLNGKISGNLVLPQMLPRGKYTLYLAVQPRFFEVVGKINGSKPAGMLNAMLLTRKGEWDTQEIPVEPDGTFTVDNWLFQDNGLIAFSRTDNNTRDLDIRISTRLDSTYEPAAMAVREIYFGTPAGATPRIDSLGRNIQTDKDLFFDRGELLPAVIVKAKTKSRAEQFDEEYSSGLFKSSNERLISIMDDPSALGSQSLLAYLQGRVAGLQISYAGFGGGGRAIWRGAPVTFFIDEMRTDAQMISNIPMNDIAIVKAYPPPFMGAPGGGSGGAIAVYTKRGGEASLLPDNRTVFQIKGYTALTTVLDMNKLSL